MSFVSFPFMLYVNFSLQCNLFTYFQETIVIHYKKWYDTRKFDRGAKTTTSTGVGRH